MKERIENKDICKECGGYCCKKCGCDYFVSDFESIKMNYIEEALQTRRVSIVAALDFSLNKNKKLMVEPVLYLRARNINRGAIDLLSLKTTCASLTEDGCYYNLEDRPAGGAALIPKKVGSNIACYSEIDRLEELNKWRPYQDVLQKVVRKHTGMNVYSKLRSDAEQLFVDIIEEKFEGVSKDELRDVLGLLPRLHEVYPDEYQKALKRSKNASFVLSKRK